MYLAFTPEQEDLRSSLRSFLRATSSPEEVRRQMARPEGYDPQLWKRMAQELGLPGIALPEEVGGSGYTFIEQAVVLEELGRTLACSPYFSTVVLAATALLEGGDGDAQARYLPGIADGTTTATLAAAEESGEWVSEGRTTATPSQDGNEYRLDGHKSFVLDGHTADLILVVAQTPQGPSLFAVDGRAPGLTRRRLDTMDQTRKLAVLDLAGTPGRLVGALGDAQRILPATLRVATVALAIEDVGGADHCLVESVEYAKNRFQFGRAIGGFQAIKHLCADLLVRVESARSAAYYAAWAVQDRTDELPLVASLAKAYCSDAYVKAAADMIQIHGGLGFTWEHDAHLYYRRSRSSAMLFGTPEEHRDRVAGLLLGTAPVRQ
jgi:alkylation response protein AidB-like acyl-CoA dehydrogenase